MNLDEALRQIGRYLYGAQHHERAQRAVVDVNCRAADCGCADTLLYLVRCQHYELWSMRARNNIVDAEMTVVIRAHQVTC